MKTGAEQIAEARAKQVSIPGRIAFEDEQYCGDLSANASCYAKFAQLQEIGDWSREEARDIALRAWQGNSDDFQPSKDVIENLIQAGALIAAEIERIQRNTK